MKKIMLITLLISTTIWAQEEEQINVGNQYGLIHIDDYVKLLPEKHDGVIKDIHILDREHVGARVFRLYDKVPMHYHAKSDAYLYVLNGKGEFFIGDKGPIIAKKGDLIFWAKGTAHGVGNILEGPLDILVFDTLARDPSDVIWIDPATQKKFLGNE
ncbi:MAG: cupin domain-containing protein [Bacteroidota bacterium]